jgi:predicted kinase
VTPREPQPSVHLLCGLPGAGKSTYAQHLADIRLGVRFSLDEWMIRLYGLPFDHPDYPSRSERCQQLISDVALQVLRAGHDVVLDWNQWSRQRRARWGNWAHNAGYRVELHYLVTSLETSITQALTRREQPESSTSHNIDEAEVRHLADIFEPPTEHEGISITIVSS